MPRVILSCIISLLVLSGPSASSIGAAPLPAASVEDDCAHDVTWTEAVAPVRIHGTTWHVGPKGLGVFLVTSPSGHVLIDGGGPGGESLVLDNLRRAGVEPRDVKWILISHAHCDHAGAVAALVEATGAEVIAGEEDVALLARGGADDPQYGDRFRYPPVRGARGARDGEVLRLGALTVTAHATPGHTRGNMTWAWSSCDAERCVQVVDVGSLSAPDYRLLDNPGHSTLLADYAASFAKVAALRCELALAPHPGMVDFWERVASRERGALLDAGVCRRYAEAARTSFQATKAKQEQARGAKRRSSGS